MENKLARNLQNLRESKDWTKTTVAKKLGIKTVSTYANWEYGIREPDNETLTKLADLYGVSTDYLLGRTDDPRPIDKDEEEFKQAISDPDLKVWWESLPESDEEELKALREMWKIIKKNRK